MSLFTRLEKIGSNSEPLLQQSLSTLKVLNRSCAQTEGRQKKVTQSNFPQNLQQIQQQVGDLKYLQTKLKQTRKQNPIEFWMFNEQKTDWQKNKCKNSQVIFQIERVQRECQILRAKEQHYTKQLEKIVNHQDQGAGNTDICQERLLYKYQRKLKDLYIRSDLSSGNSEYQMSAVQLVDEAISRLLQARKEKRRLKQVCSKRKIDEKSKIVSGRSLVELRNKYLQLVSERGRLKKMERQSQQGLQLLKATRVLQVNKTVEEEVEYFEKDADLKYQAIIKKIKAFQLIAEKSNKIQVASQLHNLLNSLK